MKFSLIFISFIFQVFIHFEYKFSFHWDKCLSSVQSLSHVRLFGTPWTAAHQASLSITNSQSLLKLTPNGISLVAQTVKCLPTMQETRVRSLGWEDPPDKEMATHSSTLAWKSPWMEEPGRLQSMGSQRVRHD